MSALTEPQKEFLLTLAYLYLQNAKWDRALTVLKALNVLYPGEPQIARCLALALLNTDQADAALWETEAGFANPATREEADAARLLKARALWALGHETEARRALAQNPAATAATP